MGYSDLNIQGSDLAADCALDALGAMVKSLKKSLKEKGNSFNTSGPVNVALFLEEFIRPNRELDYEYFEDLHELIKETILRLDDDICDAKDKELWDEEWNRLMHLKVYQRLGRFLNSMLGDYE